MDNKIGKYEFVAEPFHVDFRGRLSLGILGNHLLNCASFHAKDRGFGMATLNEQHYTWVLSRLVIEMNEYPKDYKKFSIETWVENVYSLFTDRNYRIANENDKTMGYARSIWAMINMEDRKPINLLKVNDGKIMDYVSDYPCPIEKPSKIKLKAPSLKTTHSVVYSDLDINGHMNSIRYIEHVLDLFDIEYYKNCNIKRFEIAYVAESYFGDTLYFYTEETEQKHFLVEIKKNEGETVCRCVVKFE